MSGHRMVQSRDGTPIAYDTLGEGPLLILVGGAFSFRRYQLGAARGAARAALHRGELRPARRGDSGDAPAYAVEREIDDLDVLVETAGGSAHVFGMSSERCWRCGRPRRASCSAGGGLPAAVQRRRERAPAAGRLRAAPRRARRVRARGETVSCFMREGMGAPRARSSASCASARPIWKNLRRCRTRCCDGAAAERHGPREAARPRAVGVDRHADPGRHGSEGPGVAPARADALAARMPDATRDGWPGRVTTCR